MRFVVVSILVAAVFPFLLLLLTCAPSRTTLARWGPDWDNRNARASQERLQGWRRRAHFAQLNGHEAFAPFAAAMILAHLTAAPPSWVHPLALTFLGFRGLYSAFYVADWPTFRSIAWCAAAACVLGIFAAALSSG
jgi:uncharacterized MAPEG superfamily protein